MQKQKLSEIKYKKDFLYIIFMYKFQDISIIPLYDEDICFVVDVKLSKNEIFDLLIQYVDINIPLDIEVKDAGNNYFIIRFKLL